MPNPSLAELRKHCDAQQLEVIADFLGRNAQRLRDDQLTLSLSGAL